MKRQPLSIFFRNYLAISFRSVINFSRTHRENNKSEYLKSYAYAPFWRLQPQSVQTTAEVCTDYTCSLQKLQLSAELKYTYLLKYLRVLTNACILILKKSPHSSTSRVGRVFFNNWEYISLLRLTDEATHTIAHLHLEASIAIGWQNKQVLNSGELSNECRDILARHSHTSCC